MRKTMNHPVRRKNWENPFLHDFFNTGLNTFIGRDTNHHAPAVNVSKVEDSYTLEMFTPGYTKEDIQIDINNDLLTISSSKEADEVKEGVKVLRRERKISKFSRQFQLNEEIDEENISAAYKNGVLTINLPLKAQEEKKTMKKIEIQ